MAVLPAALGPNPIECKPFSSVKEFHQTYSISVDREIISIAEKVTSILIVALKTHKGSECCWDDLNPSHVHQGIFYFVLSSTKYTAKYVYSFDPDRKSIACLIVSLRNPQFFENLVVEFGTGFTRVGSPEIFYDGRGIITIYALSAPRAKEVRKHIIDGGSGSGWDGSIKERTREICAFDHVTEKTLFFSLQGLPK